MTKSKFKHHCSPGKFHVLLCYSLIAFLIAGCADEKTLYTELVEIGGDGWANRDSIKFAFDVQDTSRVYQLRLDVIHDQTYPWQNTYVQIFTEFPDDSVKTDVLSLELTDGSGGWLGRCSRDKCRLTIPLQSRVRFPLPGPYALTFVQYMREEVVPGLKGIRLSVVELDE